MERVDSFGVEQLGDADFSSLAPVRAVGRESDVGAAEGEVLRGEELWAVGEDVVVSFEDELGVVGGGDDDCRDLAELEVDDGSEFLGEFGEGVVWHVC